MKMNKYLKATPSLEGKDTVSKFYKITNDDDLYKVQNLLISEGYSTPDGKIITMLDFKRAYPRNRVYVIHARYNNITKRLEYTGGTTQIYATCTNTGKIKFEEMN